VEKHRYSGGKRIEKRQKKFENLRIFFPVGGGKGHPKCTIFEETQKQDLRTNHYGTKQGKNRQQNHREGKGKTKKNHQQKNNEKDTKEKKLPKRRKKTYGKQ